MLYFYSCSFVGTSCKSTNYLPFRSRRMYWPLLTLTFNLLSLSFYTHCFSPTSGILGKLKFCLLSYFGITRRNVKINYFLKNYVIFHTKNICTASIRSLPIAETVCFNLTGLFWTERHISDCVFLGTHGSIWLSQPIIIGWDTQRQGDASILENMIKFIFLWVLNAL